MVRVNVVGALVAEFLSSFNLSFGLFDSIGDTPGMISSVVQPRVLRCHPFEFVLFLRGADIARMFPRPSRVAIVYRSELINKFVENTAVNLGAQLLVCDSREEALRYLLDDGHSIGA